MSWADPVCQNTHSMAPPLKAHGFPDSRMGWL
jgi:hypothetical protein